VEQELDEAAGEEEDGKPGQARGIDSHREAFRDQAERAGGKKFPSLDHWALVLARSRATQTRGNQRGSACRGSRDGRRSRLRLAPPYITDSFISPSPGPPPPLPRSTPISRSMIAPPRFTPGDLGRAPTKSTTAWIPSFSMNLHKLPPRALPRTEPLIIFALNINFVIRDRAVLGHLPSNRPCPQSHVPCSRQPSPVESTSIVGLPNNAGSQAMNLFHVSLKQHRPVQIDKSSSSSDK
jgi:hypothetical protein